MWPTAFKHGIVVLLYSWVLTQHEFNTTIPDYFITITKVMITWMFMATVNILNIWKHFCKPRNNKVWLVFLWERSFSNRAEFIKISWQKKRLYWSTWNRYLLRKGYSRSSASNQDKTPSFTMLTNTFHFQ